MSGFNVARQGQSCNTLRGDMKLKVYLYEKCGTCRKAMQFLNARGVEYAVVPIREQPPTRAELQRMLAIYGGRVRRLFNTSGLEYKRLGLATRLPKMSEDEALDLLAGNGMLVKRPFVLTEKSGVVGFDEASWRKLR
jgi:arsenate reductase